MRIPTSFFAKTDNLILKLMKKCTESLIAKMILTKKKEVQGFTISIFKTYYKAIVIKTVWYYTVILV